MSDDGLTIQRRFPTFDFVLYTKLAPKDAASRLELLLAPQERPAGFALADTRVDGAVLGSTFHLQRRNGGFGGSVRPYAEGYFIPADGGSQVYVRVQISRWWWLFSAFVLAAMLAFHGPGNYGGTFLRVVLVGIALLAGSAIPVWLEGSQMVELMQRVVAVRTKSQ